MKSMIALIAASLAWTPSIASAGLWSSFFHRTADAQTAPAPMTPGEALGALKAANDTEMEAAALALKRSHNKSVKAFAAHMRHDHAQSNRQVMAFAKKNGKRPAGSATSEDLARMGREAMDHLKELKGSEFDKAYVDGQVDAHKKVQDLLTRAAGEVKDAALVDLLNKTNEVVAAHLSEATSLQQKLSK